MKPLSIVTVHLNDFKGLEKTFQSLAPLLNEPGMEWIVIDGASKCHNEDDNRIVQRVGTAADHFVSEPDKGIYDAMNKGTRFATGDYVLYLNAGDRLHPEFHLENLLSDNQQQRPAMIWGTCYEQYPNGDLVRIKTRPAAFAWYGLPVNHQNILFRRDLLGFAPYSLKYRFNADYDLLSRILAEGGEAVVSSSPISIFLRGGLNTANYQECLKEEAQLRTMHYHVPRFISWLTCQFKIINFRISGLSSLRKMWRRWI